MPFFVKSVTYRLNDVDFVIAWQGKEYHVSMSRDEVRDYNKAWPLFEQATGFPVRSKLPPDRVVEFENKWNELANTELEKIDRRN